MQEQSGSKDRAYFAQRAAEEFERAEAATDEEAAAAHRELQRAYLEKASVGARDVPQADEIG
jgi:hypothetical protein